MCRTDEDIRAYKQTTTGQVNGRSSSHREDDIKKKHEDVQEVELYTTRRNTKSRTSRTRQDGRDGSAQGSTTDLTNDERCNDAQETQCIDQIEQDMQRLYAEAQKADMEAEISLATMQKNQSEEQEHNIEFETRQQGQDTEFQDQQQTRSENEVKRVVKLDKAGNIVCDRGRTGSARQGDSRNNGQIYEVRVPSEEAKRKEHLLRHWEVTTRSEEMGLRKQEIELRKQELQLKFEQDKHEIEMQERKNTLEMQQDEHKRRMNSTLW